MGAHHKYPRLHLVLHMNLWHFLTLKFVFKVMLAIQNLCPQANIVSNKNILRQKSKRGWHLKPNSLTLNIFDLDFWLNCQIGNNCT